MITLFESKYILNNQPVSFSQGRTEGIYYYFYYFFLGGGGVEANLPTDISAVARIFNVILSH